MATSRSRQLRLSWLWQSIRRAVPCCWLLGPPSPGTELDNMNKSLSPVPSRRAGCGTRDTHRLWLNFEPCGMLCALMVHAIAISCCYGMIVTVIFPWLEGGFWAYFHSLGLLYVTVMAQLCHVRAMMSNPGAVPSSAKPVDPAYYERHCHRCNNFKPPRAHHCSVCNRCVVKMDHHCPWINSCVGIANHKFFVLFVSYISIMCGYSLCLLFFRFLHCVSPTSTCDTTASQAVGMLLMTITAILFGLFTGCLLLDQIQNIISNTTQIDKLKGHAPQQPANDIDDRKQLWHNLGEVFGGDPAREGVQWTWFFPVPVRFQDPEGLTGFCFRDVPRPRTQAEMEMV